MVTQNLRKRYYDDVFLVKLYVSGKLGNADVGMRRLSAGIRLINDYAKSFFAQRTTCVYGIVVKGGKRGFSAGEASLAAQEAADRYLAALKALGKYQVYAVHFIRDGENVRSFILKHRVLNADSLLTYRAVYKAINDMLDRLAAHYDKASRAV